MPMKPADIDPLETIRGYIHLTRGIEKLSKEVIDPNNIEKVILDQLDLLISGKKKLSPLAQIAYDIAYEKTKYVKRKTSWPLPLPTDVQMPEITEPMAEVHHNLRILALYWATEPTQNKGNFSRQSPYFGKVTLDDIVVSGIFLHDLLGDGKKLDIRISIPDLKKELVKRIGQYNSRQTADPDRKYDEDEISLYVNAVLNAVDKLDRKSVFDRMCWLAHNIDTYMNKSFVKKYSLSKILEKGYNETFTLDIMPHDPEYVYSDLTLTAMYISDFVRLLTGNWQKPQFVGEENIDWAYFIVAQGIDITETPVGRDKFSVNSQFIRQNQIYKEESTDYLYEYVRDILPGNVLENSVNSIHSQKKASIISKILNIRSVYLLDPSIKDHESINELVNYFAGYLHLDENESFKPSEEIIALFEIISGKLAVNDLSTSTLKIIKALSDIYTSSILGIELSPAQLKFRERIFKAVEIDMDTRESPTFYSKYTKMKRPNKQEDTNYPANITDILANTVKFVDVPENLLTLAKMVSSSQAAQVGKYLSGDAADIISWHDNIYIPSELIDPLKYYSLMFNALKTSGHGNRVLNYLRKEFLNYSPETQMNALAGGIPIFFMDEPRMEKYIEDLERRVGIKLTAFKRDQRYQALPLSDVQKVIYWAVAPQLKGYQKWMLSVSPPPYYLEDIPIKD